MLRFAKTCIAALVAFSAPHFGTAHAAGIKQLLMQNTPVPTRRPDLRTTGSLTLANNVSSFTTLSPQQSVRAVNGTLKDGLSAIGKGDTTRALGIRAGMAAGSLDRKLLAWVIAISGKDGISSGTIAKIAGDLPAWPGQTKMMRNIEEAIVRETSSGSGLIKQFGNRNPVTTDAKLALAQAYMETGQTSKARSLIRPLWREKTLNKKTEAKILKQFSGLLQREDHRHRMHQLFYNDRIRAAERVAPLAQQVSLAKARAAAIRKSSNAVKTILGVAPSSKKDVGYTFSRIEYARRTENFELAKKLLLSAPTNPQLLIDADEWWVERRIVSRSLVERGDYKNAYRIAAGHSAQSASSIIDAEFHAGWYALRFLKDAATARKHFARILNHATRPISKSRGHYWMGRASNGGEATRHFQLAAAHPGTFYGQLAAHKLGVSKLSVSRPKPTQVERTTYANRELVRAIKRLEATGNAGWTPGLYLHLAKTLKSSGELAMLAADAERKGKYQLSLQVGKIANGRGLKVDTLAWPIGAIPGSAKISSNNKAIAYAISRQESAFDKAAISPANARGLMQLLPGTAKAVAKRRGYKYSKSRLTRDAAYNATLGTAYLSEQMKEFGNSYVLTFIAYNAGPRRVGEWIERFGDPRGKGLNAVVDWVEQIPYTETRHYVQRILENYQVYKARLSGSSLAIEKDLRTGRR